MFSTKESSIYSIIIKGIEYRPKRTSIKKAQMRKINFISLLCQVSFLNFRENKGNSLTKSMASKTEITSIK